MTQGSSDPRAGGGGSAPTVATEQVKQQTQQAVQQTQQVAGQAAQRAQQQAQTFLDGQKTKGAETLSSIAQALRQSGDQLRQQDQAPVAQVTDKAADELDRVTGYLNQHSAAELVGDVEDFTRRNTVLFLGAAFTLGVFAARFLKSTSSQSGAPSGYQGRSTGSQYRVSGVPYRYEDVSGAPYVVNDYSPGMAGSSASRFAGVDSTAGSEIDGTPAR